MRGEPSDTGMPAPLTEGAKNGINELLTQRAIQAEYAVRNSAPFTGS